MLNFFDTAGIKILNIYGCSENAGPGCVSTPAKNKTGAVGPPMPPTEVKVLDPDRFVDVLSCKQQQIDFICVAMEKESSVSEGDISLWVILKLLRRPRLL